MTPPRGAPRKLSDNQIQTILAWHDARRRFQRSQGTVAALAQRLGVSMYAISWCIAQRNLAKAWASRRVRLTARQRRQILNWHRRRDAFRQRHGTLERLAKRLSVSPRTVQQCIRRVGRYAQVTAAELPAARVRAKARRQQKSGDWRIGLLREWLMNAPVVEERLSCALTDKSTGVKEVDAPPAVGALGCACVWFLIQSVESRGIRVSGVTPSGNSASWLIPYAQISRLLPAGALQRRIRHGRARISRDQRAALMVPVFGF